MRFIVSVFAKYFCQPACSMDFLKKDNAEKL